MTRFPADSESRRTDSRACAIVHYQFDSNHWQYREVTGQDIGCDCEFELSEDSYWRGSKIECQVKGTKHIDKRLLKDNQTISFPLEIKTICYGLGKKHAFVLLVVDVVAEIVYYQNIHEYFIENPALFQKLDGDAKAMSIRIPIENRLDDDDLPLRLYASTGYEGGPYPGLRVTNPELREVSFN